MLVVVAAALSVVVVQRDAQAEANAERVRAEHAVALSRKLAAASRSTDATDPVLSRRLALSALTAARTPEALDVIGELVDRQDEGILIGHTEGLWQVAYSPDGSTLATAGGDGKVRFWDARTRRLSGPSLRVQEFGGANLAYSPDGKTLVTANGTVQFWDVDKCKVIGDPLVSPDGNTAGVGVRATFSSNGLLLATSVEEGPIRLWDVKTHKMVAEWNDPSGYVDSISFSQSNNVLATGGKDGAVRLWNLESRTVMERLVLFDREALITSITFSPDGAMMAAAAVNEPIVPVWNLRRHEPVGTPLRSENRLATAVAFGRDSSQLAVGYSDRSALIWDAASLRQVGTPLIGHGDGISSLAFSPTGDVLATSAGLGARPTDSTVRLWDLRTHALVGSPSSDLKIKTSVAISPDGSILAAGDPQGIVQLWDASNFQALGHPLTGHAGTVKAMQFNFDETLLASGAADGTTRLWDVKGEKPVGIPLVISYKFAEVIPVDALSFSHDGRLLSAGGGPNVQLWNTSTGLPAGPPLVGHPGPVISLAFSSNDSILAAGTGIRPGDGSVFLWEVKTAKILMARSSVTLGAQLILCLLRTVEL